MTVKNQFPFIPYFLVGRTFVLPIFYPKSAVGREIGAFGEEVQFLFEDWGKIVVIR